LLCIFFEGAFRDSENGIEGACGPVLIHTNKSKSRKSEAEDERERQRKGGEPAAHKISPRFLEGIDDPEMMVLSTYSGSMTQEAFYHYVQHCHCVAA
jgi:hypothetical protein